MRPQSGTRAPRGCAQVHGSRAEPAIEDTCRPTPPITSSRTRACSAPSSTSAACPCSARTVRRVGQLARSDEAGVGEMVAVLEADQGLATDLLRYANSAACARPLRVRSIRSAVTLVGRLAISRLALEAATFGFFERAPGNAGRSVGQLNLHAAAVATGAQAIAERTGANSDVAHLAGLLHDVGKLVLPLAFGARRPSSRAAERHRAGAARDPRRARRRSAPTTPSPAGSWPPAPSSIPRSPRRSPPTTAAPTAAERPSPRGRLRDHRRRDRRHGRALRARRRAARARARRARPAARGPRGRDRSRSSAGLRPGADLTARMAELERQARVDDLTGVLNRRHWLATVRRAIDGGERGSVLLCDVDHFKARQRRATATPPATRRSPRSRAGSRGHGIAGRLGGDEFAVWIPGDADRCAESAARILDEVAGVTADVPEPRPPLGVSIGSVTVTAADQSLHRPALARRRGALRGQARRRGRAVSGS